MRSNVPLVIPPPSTELRNISLGPPLIHIELILLRWFLVKFKIGGEEKGVFLSVRLLVKSGGFVKLTCIQRKAVVLESPVLP